MHGGVHQCRRHSSSTMSQQCHTTRKPLEIELEILKTQKGDGGDGGGCSKGTLLTPILYTVPVTSQLHLTSSD